MNDSNFNLASITPNHPATTLRFAAGLVSANLTLELLCIFTVYAHVMESNNSESDSGASRRWSFRQPLKAMGAKSFDKNNSLKHQSKSSSKEGQTEVASRSTGLDTSTLTNSHPHIGSDDTKISGRKLKLTGRVLQTLVTRALEIADPNPVKVALGLIKTIIDVAQIIKQNKDTIARAIVKTGQRLELVEATLSQITLGRKEEEALWLNHFKTALLDSLNELKELDDKSKLVSALDHEDITVTIRGIFERIDDSRVELELALGIRTFKAIYQVDKAFKDQFLERLRPSNIAHHDYNLEGQEGQMLHRRVCTPGTRVGILGHIVAWAKDISETSPKVFWLFGHVGSGKTTIAYSIARRFEFAGDSDDTIVLGANFFASRQFDETRLSKYIVPTIVYHLALKCKPFAEALYHSGRLEVINHNIATQLDALLFGPWKKCESARRADTSIPQHYLIVIDALDEIERSGGSQFLLILFDILNRYHQNDLYGLKFFLTSRTNKEIVDHVNSLLRKEIYHLQDVKEEDAREDISKYLRSCLPHFVGRPELDALQEHAAGLFIYAATFVKLLEHRKPAEQKRVLNNLLSNQKARQSQSSLQDSQMLLNRLYYDILIDAFGSHSGDERMDRLSILYTFLCAKEPLTIAAAADILFEVDVEEEDPEFSYLPVAKDVVERLHSVIYVKDDRVLFYHKSFPDFMMDKARSRDFWLDLPNHHRRLTNDCFRLMENMLRFNIANIPTSFYFDEEVGTIKAEIERNIPPSLRYACRHWDHHLCSTVPITSSEPLNQTLSCFLKLKALFWIEAMNLLGFRGHCYPMLQAARDWTATLSDTSALLSRHFAEAAYFAVYFSGSPASLSTPHLYISSLATWPRSLHPCGNWKAHFPRIPRFRNALQGGTTVMSFLTNGEVISVAISADDTHIVAGLSDGSVRVWHGLTGEVEHLLEGHDDQVNSVSISGNGGLIASGSTDKSIRLWDTLTGEAKGLIKGHNSIINAVALSKDGTQVVSGASDKLLRIWDTLTGTLKATLLGHLAIVKSVTFSSDGSRIISGAADNSIRVWDVSTGTEVYSLSGHTDWVYSVAFSDDGTSIVSGSADGLILIWDTSKREVTKTLKGHIGLVKSVAFSLDGTRIVSGGTDCSVRLWNVSTGKETNLFKGHVDYVYSVAFTGDGTRIISSSADRTIRMWDAVRGEEEVHITQGHSSAVKSVAISRDGSLIVTGSSDKSVRVWSGAGQVMHVLMGHKGSVNSVAISEDATLVVSGSSDNSIRVWDALTGEQKCLLERHTSSVQSVSFAGNSTSRIRSGSGKKIIRLSDDWDFVMEQEHKFSLKSRDSRYYNPSPADCCWNRREKPWVNSIAFSPTAIIAVAGLDNGLVQLITVANGHLRKVTNLQRHSASVNSVTFSRDGCRIVSGSDDGTAHVSSVNLTFDRGIILAKCDLIGTLECHWQVQSVSFSNDGRRIAAGLADGSIIIYHASKFYALYGMYGHRSSVRSLTFSMDNTRLISGSDDASVRVWNVASIEKWELQMELWCKLENATNGAPPYSISPDDNDRLDMMKFSNFKMGEVMGEERFQGLTDTLKLPLNDCSTFEVEPQDIRYVHQRALVMDSLNVTGWLYMPLDVKYGKYLMFVPPSDQLPDDSNIITIPESCVSRVDFTDAKIGDEWSLCYSPKPME
ncbi:hypothetical protein JR316_0006675 [Psilocybe cubensis]|uniref:Uncharacterized protein n=2 Tax=Psilocybe cubensis TaxID=181762 RepID=A0ACB8GWF2_PSICU|nr:hypothetical protein JR316_0006675 [Psilocybe cubensis]KAH9480078.1 hypothetical protein JR316_0006675 [Psilocybe cubensis]